MRRWWEATEGIRYIMFVAFLMLVGLAFIAYGLSR